MSRHLPKGDIGQFHADSCGHGHASVTSNFHPAADGDKESVNTPHPWQNRQPQTAPSAAVNLAAAPSFRFRLLVAFSQLNASV